MNSFEQQILDVIQDAFPLAERPYAVLAKKIGSDETTVFDAVEKMRASGVIRRIGGIYDSKKLGFISRLCAGKVPASSLDFFAEPHSQTPMEMFADIVMGEPAITHNYIRSHEYNVWFTVIAENESAIQAVVDRVCAKTELCDVHVLSATKKFKINTVMGASAPVNSRSLAVSSDCKKNDGESDGRCEAYLSQPTKNVIAGEARQSTAGALTEADRNRIRAACGDIPHSLTPFADWNISCEELREDLAAKRMRRFGAILWHQQAGFAYNAMVCFRIVESRKSEVRCDENAAAVQKAGSILASNPHISHCYERPTFEGFSYNLYAMMHAPSAELLSRYIEDAARSIDNDNYVVLNSLSELKKTSFGFFA